VERAQELARSRDPAQEREREPEPDRELSPQAQILSNRPRMRLYQEPALRAPVQPEVRHQSARNLPGWSPVGRHFLPRQPRFPAPQR
jgi:hypothetical protein